MQTDKRTNSTEELFNNFIRAFHDNKLL